VRCHREPGYSSLSGLDIATEATSVTFLLYLAWKKAVSKGLTP
jgi:hypothetical protein